MTTDPQSPDQSQTIKKNAGAAVLIIVKHIPLRMALFGIGAFVIGIIGIFLSIVLAANIAGRAAMGLGYVIGVAAFICMAGTSFFTLHGLHRGIIHAILALEEQFGIIRKIITNACAHLREKFGPSMEAVSRKNLEQRLNEAVAIKEEIPEVMAAGLRRFFIKRVKRVVSKKSRKFLLKAYQNFSKTRSTDGSISLEKFESYVTAELINRLRKRFLKPLNITLAITLPLYIILTVTWWLWLLAALLALVKLLHL
jgi:hypothetical protein